MRWFTHNARTPVGVDIGAHSIKAVQLRRAAGRWEACAATIFPRATPDSPFDGAEAARLHDVMERQGFLGRDLILSVPPQALMSDILDLPPRAAGVPIDQIAQAEFARIHKCDPASFTMSYWDLPAQARASKATHAMAVGYACADAEAYLDLVEGAGLNVVAIDVQASAITRACQPLLGTGSGMAAVLDLGWSAASFAVVHGGVVTYERSVPEAGLRHLFAALKPQVAGDSELAQYFVWNAGFVHSDVGSHDAELIPEGRDVLHEHVGKLVSELLQALGYAARQYPDFGPGTLLLVGGGGDIPGLDAHLRDVLGMEVKVAAGRDVVACPSSLAGRLTAAAMPAIGLAQFAGR